MRSYQLWCACCLVSFCARGSEDRCTSIIVGRDASGEGKPVTSHTVDCASCDFRLAKVPRRRIIQPDRAVYRYRAEYPRFLGSGKGTTYENAVQWYPWRAKEGPFAPIGTIDESQTTETYAFVDGAYGIMNEKGLAIGESTCGASLVGRPVDEGGEALLDVRELTLIALEQCATARCAVEKMGSHAERYGYYGADSSFVEAGEALTIVDDVEAWIFHILADDQGGRSAVWAAQRVEPGHVAVVANQFIIGELPDVSSLDSGFVVSGNARLVARRAGLWRDGEPFHFAKVFGIRRGSAPARYSTLRQWRVLSLAAQGLEPPSDECEYECLPFSVAAAQPFPATRVIATLRDHYEGTAFDMTKGPAAGPFGDPSRFDPGDNRAVFGHIDGVDNDVATKSGHYERAISIFRCAYSFVSQPSDTVPVFWVSQYAPHSGSYVPVYVDALEVPHALSVGSLHAVDLEAQYWPHALVGNWAARFYRVAQPIVATRQDAVDSKIRSDRIAFEETLKTSDSETIPQALTQFANQTAAYEANQYVALFFSLAATVKDGQLLTDVHAESLSPQKIFYPRSWLQRSGFFYDDSLRFWKLDTDHMASYLKGLDSSIKLAVAFGAGALFGCALRSRASMCCRQSHA